MLSPGGRMTREEAVKALKTRCWCGRDLGVHEVPCPEVPFPTAMLRYPHLRQSTLSEFWQCHLLAYFKNEHETGWHSQPQARGSFFHLWAATLLRHLEVIGRDKLRDEPECELCGARPNEEMTQEEFEARGEMYYAEGEVCPTCGEGVLQGKALEDVAVDLLLEVMRQRDVPDEERLPLPYGEHMYDLLWIVRKFAREQSFSIDRLVDVERRVRSAVYYPNPYGGVVERVFSGQMDAVFMGASERHLVVLDWKDTWAIPGPASISTEGYFQQRAYALLLMDDNPDVDAVTLREVYVRFGAGDSGEENHRTATIYRKQLPEIRKELAVIAEAFDLAVEEGHERRILWYNPSPGGHCNYCPLPQKCPAWDSYEELRDAGPIQSEEQAEEVAGLLTVAKRVAKLMELRLKAHLGKPGPRPSAPVRVGLGDKETGDALQVYNDKRPGLPPGVPIKTAKGQKVYAYVEGKRTSKPEPHEVEAALEARAKGIPVKAEDLYRTGTTTTFRLVELAVPVDPDVQRQAARVASEASDG